MCLFVHVYVFVHLFVHIYVFVHLFVHVYVFVCTCVCVCVCVAHMHMCACVCMHVCMHPRAVYVFLSACNLNLCIVASSIAPKALFDIYTYGTCICNFFSELVSLLE